MKNLVIRVDGGGRVRKNRSKNQVRKVPIKAGSYIMRSHTKFIPIGDENNSNLK